MTVQITNAPAVLKSRIIDLCRETYDAHRDAAPQDWPENFFDLYIEPQIQSAFLDPAGRPLDVSPNMFVALKDETFAGYYRLSSLPTNPETDYFSVELQDILVLPVFRGQGVGAALVAHAKALAETHDWDILEATVADWNEGSRRLFEREGFAVKSRKLAIGPDRPARAIPTPPPAPIFTRRDWFWILLTGANIVAAVIFLAR